MPLITTHLPSLDDSILRKSSLADFSSPSKTTSPALPPRSSLRASRTLSSTDLTTRPPSPPTTANRPRDSSTPELSPSTPNPSPYDSYLSEEDASESADDDYDVSTISLAYPHADHSGPADREDVARIVAFMFVGKPTIVSISISPSRPGSAESLHASAIPHPPRRSSTPTPPPPRLPPRPRAHSIRAQPAPGAPSASLPTASPPLPLVPSDPHDNRNEAQPRPQSATPFLAREMLRLRLGGLMGGIGARRRERDEGPSAGKYGCCEEGVRASSPRREEGEGGEEARVRGGMRLAGLGRRGSVRGWGG